MKNVIIATLVIVCAVLGYLLYQKSSTTQELTNSGIPSSTSKTPTSSSFLEKESDAGLLGREIDSLTARSYYHNWSKYIKSKDAGIDTINMARSVYFSKEQIDTWLGSGNEKGFRIYFARKPGINNVDSFTVVLRAMNNMAKTPSSVGGRSVYFNLGGLCPPKCNKTDLSDRGIE